MSSLINYSSFIKHCPHVQRLCDPLINLLKFKSFRYTRVQPDGRAVMLCRKESFMRQYFDNGLYLTECVNFLFHPQTYLPGRYIWYNLERSYTNQFMAKDYYDDIGVKNGITIIKRQGPDLLIFEFGLGDSTDKSYEIACTQPEVLERFILYFTEQLADYMHDLTPIMLYDKHLLSPYEQPDTHQSIYYEQKTITSFIEQTPIKDYYDYTLGIELDKKDILCLYYLTEGQTSRQTAKFVHLSHRTVEARLDKLRERLGCKNKSDLTRLAAKSDIRKIISLEKFVDRNLYVSNTV